MFYHDIVMVFFVSIRDKCMSMCNNYTLILIFYRKLIIFLHLSTNNR